MPLESKYLESQKFVSHVPLVRQIIRRPTRYVLDKEIPGERLFMDITLIKDESFGGPS
jgi:hypothetical protein